VDALGELLQRRHCGEASCCLLDSLSAVLGLQIFKVTDLGTGVIAFDGGNFSNVWDSNRNFT
jgi:hypothetical protein